MRTTNGDEEIECKDCGESFIVSEGERELYSSRGHQQRPHFCRPCRMHRRAERASAVVTRCPPKT